MKVVGEGALPSPVRAFAWSPAVDLCVFVMATEVSAHRLAGQRVWTISTLHTEDLEFTHLAWREDGTITSESTGLLDRTVHRDRIERWVGVYLGCAGWTQDPAGHAEFSASGTAFVFDLDCRGSKLLET
jgi:Anaphase-promoting complex subunit 4 WD40 domain